MPPVAAAARRLGPAQGTVSDRVVYLDHHASTPCDPRVVEAMLPFFLETYGNPSSSVHELGRRASKAVEDARSQLAAAIRAESGEILFTSGATESNNLAILGATRAAATRRRTVLTTAIEHKSVLAPCDKLQGSGYERKLIPVDRDGLVDLGAFSELLGDDTLLVSAQAVNNEIGTIQPILEIVQLAHAAGALVHCDAAQALGRIEVDVGDWGVDLLSLSAHKCYGPKGVGALYVRGGVRRAPVEPLQYGGGQEHELRPGTLNVPGIVGFGMAASLAKQEREAECARIRRLRDGLEDAILSRVASAHRNGAPAHRVAGNSSLTFPGIDAEALIANVRGVAFSTGSACTSGAIDPSHVLTAIGLSRDEAFSTVRFGLGRFTMESDIELAISEIGVAVDRLIEVA